MLGALALAVAAAGCAAGDGGDGGGGGVTGPPVGLAPDETTTTAPTRYGTAGAAPASTPATTTGAVLDPTATTGPPALRFGVAVPGADPELVAALETEAGAEVGVVRVFARWDTGFPTAEHRALLAAGRRLHLSVRPRTDAGEVIPWADIAAAAPGSAIDDQLRRWARAIAAHGPQLYFTFNHEPETADSAPNGTAPEFVAAWRRMVETLRAEGGDEVPTVLVLGRGAYADGSFDDWYPGDDVVDVLGVDPYNWYDCQGTGRPWTSAEELLAPALEVAVSRGKPLAVPEIASTEDPADPDRKAAWIEDLGRYLGRPDVAERVEFVAWFSVHDRAWPNCRWAYDSSPVSAEAFAGVVADLAG